MFHMEQTCGEKILINTPKKLLFNEDSEEEKHTLKDNGKNHNKYSQLFTFKG